MLSLSLLVTLSSLATASSLIPRNTTTINSTILAPGHYLPLNITSQTFFNNTCTPSTISVRKEWRSLSEPEKQAFITAELCLMNLPGQSGLPGAVSRFDDFQAVHQQGTNSSDGDVIHYTGIFLTWHRYHLHAHETLLKSQCNYTGALPFWDEALDAASADFFQSSMWEDSYFGGNGSSPHNCVTTGPFANRTVHVGPLEETSDYCFQRNFNNTKGIDYAARGHVDDCYALGDDFEEFYGCMAYYPHIGGHQGIGGIMTDVDASPGDPVFYLHHNYLDRLYWQWQQLNPSVRLDLIAGNTTIHEPATGWEALTTAFELDMWGLVPNVTVGDVLNVQGGYLCYEFEY